MARLPQPGGDAGNWGSILNDYLSQAHKPDGTIKDDAISAAAIQNGAISEVLLDSGVTTKLNNPTVADGAITNAKIATNAAIDADKLTDGTTNKLMSATEKTKLAGLTGKIADASDFSATNPSVGQALAVSSISGGVMTGVGVVNVLSGTATKTDNSVGLINWMNDSASGYLLHLVNGPSTTASNAALAIGTDRGAGAGLLISHKNSGIGISMGVQPGAGMGMQIAGRSTSFPLRVQLHAGSGAVSLRATTGANFSDGASTSGSTTFTSATANFTAADIGMALTQLTSRGSSDPLGSIPSGATIISVESTTSVTMSAAATATGTGVLFMVDGRAVSNTQNMLIIQDEQSATLTAINKTGINVKGADIASAPLKVSRKAGQTSPIFEVRDESSNPLTYIGKNGHITTTVTTALTASDISNNTIGMYYDPTPGSQKLVLVGKDSSGAFNTGQVALGAGSGSGPTGPVSSLTTGKYYGPSSVSISAAAPTQSRLRTHMVYFDASITVDRIGSDVTTAAAASTLRWVIYQDSNGYPGALVLDTGAVGDSTTTGWKEATINQTLAAGKYWFGCIAQGGNPTLRVSSGSIAMPGVGLSSTEIVSLTGAAVGYFIDNVTGTPPSTFTAGASATATSPLVWVRKA